MMQVKETAAVRRARADLAMRRDLRIPVDFMAVSSSNMDPVSLLPNSDYSFL
jgi:hypothetical protein|nr:hypothetical protein [uncultured Sphingomonas sp.]